MRNRPSRLVDGRQLGFSHADGYLLAHLDRGFGVSQHCHCLDGFAAQERPDALGPRRVSALPADEDVPILRRSQFTKLVGELVLLQFVR